MPTAHHLHPSPAQSGGLVQRKSEAQSQASTDLREAMVTSCKMLKLQLIIFHPSVSLAISTALQSPGETN